MAETTRSFMALRLPPEMIRVAAEIQDAIKRSFPPGSIKWVDPALFHLTVRFFGELDRKALDKAGSVVDGLDHAFAPVTVRFDGASAFPSPSRPQTLWIAVNDREGKLEALALEVDRRIRAAGFGPPDKPWKSHLTIGRAGRDARLRVDPEWTGGLTWPPADFTIGSVALMQSELRPQGPRYTPLRTASASS